MFQVKPNTTISEGVIAIFDYSGVKHIAIVSRITANGFAVKESNYDAGVIGTRFITWNDHALVGFFSVHNPIDEK